MGIEQWSTSAGSNNQAPPNGWPAGMLPSQVEPTGRQMMASVASWYRAAEWINYNFTPTYISATQFSLPGNDTATYHVGRRVQATDGATSVFGTITVSAFTTLTTVTVTWDTGVLQTGVTIVYVGITSAINTSAPTPLLSTNNTWTGNNTFNPSSGQGITINSVANGFGQLITGSATSGQSFGLLIRAGTTSADEAVLVNNKANTATYLQINGDGSTKLGWNGSTQAIATAAAGTVTINAPSSGNALVSNGLANSYAGQFLGSSTSGQSFGVNIKAGTNSSDFALFVNNQASTSNLFGIRGDGVVEANDGTGSLIELGYKDIPQNLQTANYAPALTDRGKGVDFNGTSLTCTIPANASVAFPIGTTIIISNLNATSLSIAITTDTLTLAGTTTTGTRTLGQNGMATIRKVTATSWLIAGSGVS